MAMSNSFPIRNSAKTESRLIQEEDAKESKYCSSIKLVDLEYNMG